MVWPAQEAKFPDGTSWFFLDDAVGEFDRLLMPIVDLSMMQAMSFEWRCPLSIAKDHPHHSLCSLGGPCLAAVAVGRPAPLLEVAARNAFWQISAGSLQVIARHIGCELPAKKSLYTVCFALVKFALQCDDATVVGILKHRLADAQATYVSELMEVDEALEVMDADERQECKSSQKTAETAKAVTEEFRREWTSHRALVAEAAKGNRKRKAGPKRCAKKPLPPGELSQAILKPFVPAPDGRLWRNNSNSGWEAHFPGFRRVAFSGIVHGHRMAARFCLRYLWDAYLATEGLGRDQCPIEGLWDDDDVTVAALPRAAASSSSSR